MARGRTFGTMIGIGWLTIFIGGLVAVVVYGLGITGPHLQFIAVGLVTAGAALLTGAFFGFLFGVPRVVSAGNARVEYDAKKLATGDPAANGATAKAPFWAPSSNLAEVSDWLTKLLLGAGLVSLTQLSGPLSGFVRNIADGLDNQTNGEPSGAAMVMAGSILALFAVLGFLMGYVLATIWYTHALEDTVGENPDPHGPVAAAQQAAPGMPSPNMTDSRNGRHPVAAGQH